MSRELAAYHPGYAHPYDPLIDLAEDGMTVAAVRDALRRAARRTGTADRAPFANVPKSTAAASPAIFRRPAQQAFGEKVIRAFGYDFARGRQDKTAHPFMTKLGLGDVRITTRYRERRSAGRTLLHAARSRARDVRAGHRRRARRHAALQRHDGRRARKPVAALGEPRRPQPPFWRHWYARCRRRFPASSATSTSTRSIARSTKWSRRSSAPTPTR